MKRQKLRRPPWAMRLVSARVRTGLSASAFARKLDFSQQRYDNYEQGKSEPNIAGWNLLKREFGDEIYFIITGDKLGRAIDQAAVQGPLAVARPFLRIVGSGSFNPERDIIHEGWK